MNHKCNIGCKVADDTYLIEHWLTAVKVNFLEHKAQRQVREMDMEATRKQMENNLTIQKCKKKKDGKPWKTWKSKRANQTQSCALQ